VTELRPPNMRRTRWNDLLAVAVVLGVLGWIFVHATYSSLPPLSYAVPVPIIALAVAEFVAARRVRAAVRHEPHARPMAAIAIARCVALGKASSVVAAGVFGAAVGMLIELLPDVGTVHAVGHDVDVCIVLDVGALALMAAALLLERAGVDPGNGERRDR
jgi:hypothetical protein